MHAEHQMNLLKCSSQKEEGESFKCCPQNRITSSEDLEAKVTATRCVNQLGMELDRVCAFYQTICGQGMLSPTSKDGSGSSFEENSAVSFSPQQTTLHEVNVTLQEACSIIFSLKCQLQPSVSL